MKKILLILLALAVVGGGTAAGVILLTREGAPTYSKYGFSIEYDKGMEITEEGLADLVPNDNSGMVGGVKEDDTAEAFLVVWMWTGVAVNVSELHAAVDEAVAQEVEADPYVTIERGVWESGTKAGHSMTYQSFTLTMYGETLHGVWGAWYCDQDKKIYVLVVMRADGATEMWQRYLDSFVCH